MSPSDRGCVTFWRPYTSRLQKYPQITRSAPAGLNIDYCKFRVPLSFFVRKFSNQSFSVSAAGFRAKSKNNEEQGNLCESVADYFSAMLVLGVPLQLGCKGEARVLGFDGVVTLRE